MKTDAEPESSDSPVLDRSANRRIRWPLAIVVGLIGAVGLIVRLWALGRTPIDADTAVVGLMAHEILHGHFFAFYWGQSYGGVEPYFVAILFFLFGQSTFTLGLAPLLLDVLAAVLLWRLGRRLFSPLIGLGAALLFWVWPEVYLRQATIEHGFRFAALDCGLGVLLLALRLTDGTKRTARDRHIEWLGFGALCGVGFWASPEIAYYLFPVALLLIWRGSHRRISITIVDFVLAVITAFVGALPWLYDNVTKGYPSFRHYPQPNPPGSPFINHLKVFGGHVLPLVLGFRLRTSGRWLLGLSLGEVIYGATLLVGFVFFLTLIHRRHALIVVVFLILFPLIYAYSPFTWFWSDGRYALYLSPILTLFVVGAVGEIVPWLMRSAHRETLAHIGGVTGVAGVVAVGLGLTLGATSQLAPYMPVSFQPAGRTGWFSWQSDPTGYDAQLADELEADGIHDVYAGYWMAYPLAFESRGGLIASDVRYSRYQPYLVDVEHSHDPGWLFVNPLHTKAAATLVDSSLLDPGCAVLSDKCLTPHDLEGWLVEHHVPFKVYEPSYFVAIVPGRSVSPDAVFNQFNIPTSG